ncbi:MAG: hypothetical protein ACYDC3_08465 [Candidatus Binataceae bacterium]
MNRKSIWGLLTAGAITGVLAASIMLSAPARALAQDDSTSADIADAKTPPAAMAGTWTGTVVISSKSGGGTGTLTLDLTQVKSTVGGTFNIVGAGNPSGSVRGKVTGNKVTLKLSQTNKSHPCKVNVKGEVLTLDEYKGSFALGHSKHCNGAGTFDLFLQP